MVRQSRGNDRSRDIRPQECLGKFTKPDRSAGQSPGGQGPHAVMLGQDSILGAGHRILLRYGVLGSSELQVPGAERIWYVADAFRAARTIDQIFELAHLEGGQVSLHMETFPLAELLYDIVAKFTLEASGKQVNLTIEPDVCDIQVHSDIGKLERILSNLIDNALRHTPQGGEIKLQVREMSDKQCQLTVADNGSGIKPEELSYIFDARYRASNAQGKKSRHAGLGLAITRKLVELLNTDINVKSTIGEGTAFSINLRRIAKLT